MDRLGFSIVKSLQAEYRVFDLSQQTMEVQAHHLLDRLGLLEKGDKLDAERIEIVGKGIAALWKINLIGENVEESDKEIVGNAKVEVRPDATNVKEVVNRQLDEIKKAHHNEPDWFKDSVKNLVDAAVEVDPMHQKYLKKRVVDSPAGYFSALTKAADIYRSQSTQLSWATDSGKVERYLGVDRPDSLRQIRGILEGALGPDVSKLNPMPQKE